MDNAQLKTERIEKKQERIVLVIASVYTAALFVTGGLYSWNIHIRELLPLFMAAAWVIHCRRMWDYPRRAWYVTTVCWTAFIFFAVEAKKFSTMLLVMVSLIVLLSIYNLGSALYPGFLIPVFVFLYHGFIAKTIMIVSVRDFVQVAAQVLSIYIVILVVWLIQRNRQAGNALLFEKIKDLKIAERSKNEFLVNVSHDIRTPINAVCGMSEAILQGDLSSELRGDMEDIRTAGRNLLSMVNNILDFSELDIGKLELAEESYNITSTITDIVNTALTMDNGKRLELIVDCDADLPSSLLGDEQKLRRIVVNLVGNAIKFTEEGGVILRIKSRREAYGINLSVSVRDSGIGIERTDMEKIFTSFGQADAKRSRREDGVGLGLAITQILVRSMGGFITVNSTPGVGSEFQFTIPQKVLDETPIVSIPNKKDIFVAYYINPDKFGYTVVREGYESCIQHIASQLGCPFCFCRSFTEFKERMARDNFSHIFIGWEEYCEDRHFFEELSEKRTVSLFLDYDREFPAGGQMLCICKPITVFSVAAAFNGQKIHADRNLRISLHHKFIAPQARVLVVDDNATNLKVMAKLLRPYRLKVTVASSGQEALEKLNKPEFDCVFLDHMMPDMDGVETVHRIRQNFGLYYQSLPVIAFTANAIGGAREMFVSEGFNDFIAKPIELSVLERTLRRYIPPQLQIEVVDEQEPVPGEPDADACTEHAAAEEESAFEKDSLPAQAEIAGERLRLVRAGIDLEHAYSYCGDEEGFREIAAIFQEDGSKRREDIARYFAKQDWKNYVICVHSLKGTAKNIGADDLSAAARELEYAGKEDRIDYILEHHETMMARFGAILDALDGNAFVYRDQPAQPEREPAADADGALQAGRDGAQPGDAEESREALLARIAEKLSAFESDGLSGLLDRFALTGPADGLLKENVEKIRALAADYDFLGAAEVLERIGR